MLQFVIATHGRLAEGFCSALTLITGSRNNIRPLCAFLDEEPLEQTLSAAFDGCPPGDELVVLTDLAGGSVNQYFMQKLLEGERFHLFSNISLTLLIEIVSCLEFPIDEAELTELVERVAQQPFYMNPVLQRLSWSEEE